MMSSKNNNGTYVGIDFGTTNSCMAWFNPDTKQAEPIRNSDGEEKTPSLIYYGKNKKLVGKFVEQSIHELAHFEDENKRQEELLRIVKSVKRNLISPPRIPLPSGKSVSPVDAASEIIGKLKRDAENEFFHKKISSVVLTHPAIFDAVQQEKLSEAARLAGFHDVKLLEEPVAAALAFAHTKKNIGEGVLVYDLGGGTFDLAVVVREGDSFRVAMETDGDANCGGDDFDQFLYDYWEGQAISDSNQTFTYANGAINLSYLLNCRSRKEFLSKKEKIESSSLLANGEPRKVKIKRSEFEALINSLVENTVLKTKNLYKKAKDKGIDIEKIVLIGGSSRVPLIKKRIVEELGVKPLLFSYKDLAVSLGAAYFAYQLHNKKPKPRPLSAQEHLKKARLYLKQKNEDEALEHFKQALKINSKLKSALKGCGNIYYKRKKYGLAIKEFSKVIDLDNENKEALYKRGLAYKEQGKEALAMEDFSWLTTLVSNYKKRFPEVKKYLELLNKSGSKTKSNKKSSANNSHSIRKIHTSPSKSANTAGNVGDNNTKGVGVVLIILGIAITVFTAGAGILIGLPLIVFGIILVK